VFRVLGRDKADGLGITVAHAGDFNRDGFGDVAFAAYRGNNDFDSEYLSLPGEAYVLFGKASGFAATLELATLSASDGLILPALGAEDQLGEDALGGGGDLNGDGVDDLAVGAWFADGPANARSSAGEAYVLFGSNPAASVTYKSFTLVGTALPAPTGFSHSPASRCWIGFDAGDDGSGGASLQTVTVTPSNAGIGGELSPANTANVLWQIATDRVNWTTATVTLQYLESEIAGLNEANLVLYKADSLAGPWQQVTSGYVLDAQRNRVTAEVGGFSYFALSDVAGLPVGMDAFVVQ
jgi:hypothetical protein